ncbi:MAG: rRNA pseudouridine synthase [Leptonema sp. (in: Bacteria)]|nr:rRNA pseudouridine synthase [Leptonema sp. (in: bacteria)]
MRSDRPQHSDRPERSNQTNDYQTRNEKPATKPIRLRPLSDDWGIEAKDNIASEPEYILPIQKRKDEQKPNPISKLKQLKEVVESNQIITNDVNDHGLMRINRFLSHCDLGSRREVERLIQQHRVRINGELLQDLGYRVKETDVVTVDGKTVTPITDHSYIALNKPAGYVVSRRSFPGNPAIYQLLPTKFANFGYAGRLDRESRGLVILSSDGSFIRNISHPRKGVTKRYIVTVDSSIDDSDLKIMTGRGIKDNDEVLRAVSARVVDRKAKKVEVVLTEGKNRQLRRMFEAMEYQVVDLQRTAVGRISLDSHQVKEGEYFGFSPDELTSGLLSNDHLDTTIILTEPSKAKKKLKQSKFLEE